MIAEDFRNACKQGNLKKAQEFFTESTLNSQDGTTGDCALHLAVRHNQVIIFGYLLGKNVDINIKNAKQQTPLMEALINGNEAISTLLLDQDCEVICSDVNGLNALQIAISYSKLRENAELIDLIKSKIVSQAQRNPEKYGEIEIDENGCIHNPVAELQNKLKALSLEKESEQDIFQVVTKEQLSEQILLAARLKRVHAGFEMVQKGSELMGWLGQQEAELPLLPQRVQHS